MNFKSWNAAKPYSYYNGLSNRYAVIPYEMEMSYYGKAIKQKGFELGIKAPGSKWQFINGDTLTPAIIEAFFPDFPTNIDLPNLRQGYE